MHYTSIANIHKVIDLLFLDDLTKELDATEDELLQIANVDFSKFNDVLTGENYSLPK